MSKGFDNSIKCDHIKCNFIICWTQSFLLVTLNSPPQPAYTSWGKGSSG